MRRPIREQGDGGILLVFAIFAGLLDVAFGIGGVPVATAQTNASAPDSQATPWTELLRPYRGHPVLLDVPALDDSRSVDAPSGWRLLRADHRNVDLILALLQRDRAPVIGYCDEYGNVLHVDDSARCRQRVAAGQREFGRRRKLLVEKLTAELSRAERSRRKNQPIKELSALGGIRELGFEGYPAIVRARQRLDEIDRERTAELYRLSAGEGIVPRRRLIARLEQLLARSRGLLVEPRMRVLLSQWRRGFAVRPRSK